MVSCFDCYFFRGGEWQIRVGIVTETFYVQAAAHCPANPSGHVPLLTTSLSLQPLPSNFQLYLSPQSSIFPTSITYLFLVVALETVVCHTVYYFDQRALHANIHYEQSLAWFNASGFEHTIKFGPSNFEDCLGYPQWFHCRLASGPRINSIKQ